MCGVRVFCGHWVSGRKGRICNVGIGLKMVRAAIHMWRMVMHKRSSRYSYSVEGSFDPLLAVTCFVWTAQKSSSL